MMRIFKRAGIFIVCLFIFLYTATWFYYYYGSKIIKDNFTASIKADNIITTINWIPIHWVSEAFFDRAAMYLPVYIDTIKKYFWVQFDLGTGITDFYDLSIYFPGFKTNEILLNYKTFYQNNPRYYTNFKIRIGDSMVYTAIHIPIYDQLIPDSLRITDSMYDTKAGNIGYDFIKERILIIDYKNSRIAVTDSLPLSIVNQIEYYDGAITNQKPIYLPINIDGEKILMQFDNGSSAFTMWTSVKQWNHWRNLKAKVDTFSGNSWGNKEFWYKSYPKVNIEFLNRNVTAQPIWGISKPGITEPLNFLQRVKQFTDAHFGKTVPGCIGNEYFRNEIIIIDAKHNKFGKLKNGNGGI